MHPKTLRLIAQSGTRADSIEGPSIIIAAGPRTAARSVPGSSTSFPRSSPDKAVHPQDRNAVGQGRAAAGGCESKKG